MSKKNIKTVKQPSHTPVKNVQVKSNIGSWLFKVFGPKSIGLALVGYLLLHLCISNNGGYNWAWNTLMKENWKLTQKYSKLSLDERSQMKMGFDYSYLNYVKQNTPEDAIILFPLKERMQDQGGDYKVSHELTNKYWVTHFIYPRKVVYKDEQKTNPRYKDVNYIAIIAGNGYEDLDYPVTERTYFTVLPKKQANL